MWKSSLKRKIKKSIPAGTLRSQIAENLLRLFRNNAPGVRDEYQEWLLNVEPRTLTHHSSHEYEPLISVVVPAFNTPDKYLFPLIDSFKNQSYKNWQLCLVNGSNDPERFAAIQKIAKIDNRITHIPLDENYGIAGNTNKGIVEAKGEFIAFTDHDDTLAPFALNEVVVALNKDKGIDVFYSDEDKLTDDGSRRLDPFFKPDWSPELFHTVNYLAHFIVVRASIVKKIGGIRGGYDGAQDFDFLLRVFDETQNIFHVPHISYHWRLAEGSTAKDTGEKNYADDAGQRALKDYVKRNRINAKVLPFEDQSTVYRLRYKLSSDQKVYVVSEGTEIAGSGGIYVISPAEAQEREFGSKDVVVFAKNLKLTAESVLELAGVAAQEGVGVAGGWVKSSDGGAIGYACHDGRLQEIFPNNHPDEWTHMGQPQWPRNIIFVSDRLFAIKGELYQDKTAFDLFAVLTKKKYRNVFWPFANAQPTIDSAATYYSCDVDDPYINANIRIEDSIFRLREL